MNKLILTCFLALLCLVGRYFTASSKVADSPPEVPLHRSTSVVSPHSGDTHRGGAILSDTFRYSVAPLQDNPTVVELDNRPITQAPFSPLRGAGGTNGHPTTHRSSDIQHPTTLPTPQLSLELSGNEDSKLAPHSRGLSTVDRGPNLPSSVSRLPSLRNETASLRASAPSDANLHRPSDIQHPTTLPTPQLSLELSGNEGSKLAPNNSGLSTVDPATAGRRGPNLPSSVSRLPSLRNEPASLRTSARSDDPLHRSSDIQHPTTLPTPQLSLELSGNEDSKLAPHSRGLSTVDRGPNLPSSVSRLPSLRNETASLRTSAPATSGRRSDDRLHRSPLPSQTLIYGEIINPDSLGPLTLTLKSGLLPFENYLADTSVQIITEQGTFFDGVLDPRAQKFLLKIPMDSDLALLSLNLGTRSLLKDFLIGKGDSIKIGIDMQDNTLVFGGPDKNWFEAQYSIYRNQKSERFDAPRTLLEVDKEQFLNQSDHRSKILQQDSVFGSRIRVLEMGKDGEEKEFLAMLSDNTIQVPGLEVLDAWKEKLDPSRFQLLYQWIKASYLRDRMQSLRRYHYSMPLAMGDSVSAASVLETFPKLLTQLQVLIQKLNHPDCIPCLDLAAEWAFGQGLSSTDSFKQTLDKILFHRAADRVILARGLRGLQSSGLSFQEMKELEAGLHSREIRQIWNNLTADMKQNQALAEVDLTTLQQDSIGLRQLVDKPTLVYFYFSTCTHSGNYFKNYLKPFVDQYGGELGLQVIAISVDDELALWQTQLAEYSDPEWINLNLSGNEKSDWLEKYHVKAFPRTFVLDKNARVKSFAIGGSDFDSYSSRLFFLLRQEPESKPIPHTINPTNL